MACQMRHGALGRQLRMPLARMCCPWSDEASPWKQPGARRLAASIQKLDFTADVAAESGALEVMDPTATSWLSLRVNNFLKSDAQRFETADLTVSEEHLPAQLETASAPALAVLALKVAHRRSLHGLWDKLVMRAKHVEWEALDSLVFLHCMVKMKCCDAALFTKLVDRMEGRYFSMQLGSPVEHLTLSSLFPQHHDSTFQSLVLSLPVAHVVKLILRDRVGRSTGKLRGERTPPVLDNAAVKKRWKTIDPVEMELWEREQFEKGRIRVKRIRHVEAQVTRMQPGKKLAATLATFVLQLLPNASNWMLAELSQVTAFSSGRPLHGDLLDDFQEMLSGRVAQLNTHGVMPYILAFTAGMRNYAGPEGCRAWHRILLPAIVRVARAAGNELSILDGQRSFHSHLRGVQHFVGMPNLEDGILSAQRRRAERAAQLFIAVVTARQVNVDTQLFDMLAAPLKSAVQQWLKADQQIAVDDAFPRPILLPLETLADTFGACVACGVNDNGALPAVLAELVIKQFGDDISGKSHTLSKYSISDLSVIAHGVAFLCPGISADIETNVTEVLDLVWMAAEPQLRQSEPQLVLMLLDALVRSGSEALLTSAEFVAAVDEHFVQKLDLDAAVLGRIGL